METASCVGGGEGHMKWDMGQGEEDVFVSSCMCHFNSFSIDHVSDHVNTHNLRMNAQVLPGWPGWPVVHDSESGDSSDARSCVACQLSWPEDWSASRQV